MRGWTGPLGLYVPGESWVHRSPSGVKLLLLLGATAVVATVPSLPLALGGVMTAVLLAWSAGLPAKPQLRTLRRVLLSLAPWGAIVWWQRGGDEAVELVFDLATALLLAAVLTATTRADALADSLTRACRPLDRWGFSSERFALMVALMLRAIPVLFATFSDVQEAARARGLGRSPQAYLVPFALRTVGRAQTTGDALTARGL